MQPSQGSVEKIKDPLKEELLITLHHMRIGQSREAALREFAARCDVADLDRFVASLIQSQRLGVSLGQILRTQSDHMRTVKRQRIEEAGRKAPTKMLFPLVLCISPALFVVIFLVPWSYQFSILHPINSSRTGGWVPWSAWLCDSCSFTASLGGSGRTGFGHRHRSAPHRRPQPHCAAGRGRGARLQRRLRAGSLVGVPVGRLPVLPLPAGPGRHPSRRHGHGRRKKLAFFMGAVARPLRGGGPVYRPDRQRVHRLGAHCHEDQREKGPGFPLARFSPGGAPSPCWLESRSCLRTCRPSNGSPRTKKGRSMNSLPRAGTARHRNGLTGMSLLGSLLIRFLAAAVFSVSCAAFLADYRSTGNLTSLGWMISEALVVALFLLRRSSSLISRRPSDWIAASGGSFLFLLVRPTEGSILPEQVALLLQISGVLIQGYSKVYLGRSFGVVAANRGVVSSGPYRLVRHPILRRVSPGPRRLLVC